MKIETNKWHRVPIDSIVDELRVNSTDPIYDGHEFYIGFEHIESGNLKVTTFGSLADGVSFTKTFKQKDVLFGKIRAYLRKVCIAPFDGICSGDILVLRSKDEAKLLQSFLPFYIISESFTKRAIDSSVGTTLPRTKWQHLCKHEVILPPLDAQRQIAELFQSIEKAIEDVDGQENYVKNLALKIIADLSGDKPIFGNLINSNNVSKVTLGEIAYDYSVREDNPRECVYEKYVGSDSIGRFDFKVEKWQSSKDVISSMKVFAPKDYLLVRRSLYASDFRERAPRAGFSGLCSGDILTIKENTDVLVDGYLLVILNSPRLWQFIVANASGSITRRVKWRELCGFEVLLPSREVQQKVVDLINQTQVTIDQLKRQKVNLKNLKQNLLREIFD